jgi:hypothetical protein
VGLLYALLKLLLDATAPSTPDLDALDAGMG